MTSRKRLTEATRRAHAKGVASETIGKLIGDDEAVRKGREGQEAAVDAAAPKPSEEQE